MKALFPFPVVFALAAASMLAESESVSHEYVGDIVNARCLPAAEVVSRNSRGYSPSGGIQSFAGSRYKPINTRMRDKILDTCRLHPGVTEFALVLDNGNFFKLDDAGNTEVMRLRMPIDQHSRVNLKGSVDREFVRVRTISKFPSKQ